MAQSYGGRTPRCTFLPFRQWAVMATPLTLVSLDLLRCLHLMHAMVAKSARRAMVLVAVWSDLAIASRFKNCQGSKLFACWGTWPGVADKKSLTIGASTGKGSPMCRRSHLKAFRRLQATVGPFRDCCRRNMPKCVELGW